MPCIAPPRHEGHGSSVHVANRESLDGLSQTLENRLDQDGKDGLGDAP